MSAMIAPPTSVGLRHARVSFQKPGPPVGNPDGGYEQSWIDLVPFSLSVRIAPPTARDMEQVIAGTVTATITHVISGPWHPQVTTKTRINYNGRVFFVASVANVEERNVEMVLLATEIVE
jgi:SPP1 family predicted phage head-tail adaptor